MTGLADRLRRAPRVPFVTKRVRRHRPEAPRVHPGRSVVSVPGIGGVDAEVRRELERRFEGLDESTRALLLSSGVRRLANVTVEPGSREKRQREMSAGQLKVVRAAIQQLTENKVGTSSTD